jgi:hypothetical protein
MSIKLLVSGGFGNQLFQYAAGRSLSIRLKTELVLDTRFYSYHSRQTARGFWLDDFPITGRIINYDDEFFRPHHVMRRVWRTLVSEQPKKRYYAPDIGYDPKFFTLEDGITISGCLQSYRYFNDYFDAFADELTFPPITEEWRSALPDCAADELIAVHVRRGDYLSLPGFSMSEPDRYYERAIDAAREGKSDKVVVFSDDLEWCRSRAYFKDAWFVQTPPGSPPYHDLWLMSECSKLIIANSSFSWWAAWRAAKRGAKVYAPRIWLHHRETSELDLAPPGWVIV